MDGNATYLPLPDEEAQEGSRSSVESNCDRSMFCFKTVVSQPEERLRNFLTWAEVEKQMRLAGPMIYVNLLQFSLQLISVMFVGHLGELALSSSSIAVSCAGVTGFTLLVGMGSALETLCGQAYGARQYHLLGLYMQRAIVVLNLTCVPLAVIWAYMGKVLLVLQQDPVISMKAGEYARWLIPSLFAIACAQPLLKFLQTQSLVMPMVVCSSITLFVHIPSLWLLVYKSGLGSRGAALATSISNWAYVLQLAAYVRYSKACERSRAPFSWEVFNDLKGFLKLAIPSAVMICLEYWSFESLILVSGLLPNPQLETSTLSICLSTCSLIYMIAFGLSAAASTRVSNELGAGRPLAARASVYISMGLSSLEVLIVSTTLFSIRNVLGRAYSNEPEVIQYVARLTPLIAVSTILDGIQGVLSGVARGCGWQKLGAYVNLGAYYIVGLPAAITMAFVFHLQGKGLWLGILCGLLVQSILLLIITMLTNWEKQAKEAASRVSSSLAATFAT